MMASSKLDELKALIEKQEGPIQNTAFVDYYNKGLVFVHSQVEYIKKKCEQLGKVECHHME